jgi:NitT/TauT family transport system substrate-binding protein
MAQSRSRFITSTGAGLAVAALPSIARAQGIKLRMAGVLSDSFGQPFFAKEAGAFARAGFDIDVTSLANAGAVAAAIGGGALELGIGDLISGINAINAGVPNLLLAGSGMYVSSEPSLALAVLNNSPIRVPRDLNGKTIGVPTLVGLTTASLRAWMPQNGVDVSTVKIVEIPQSAAFPAMERGNLDCALLGEPFLTPYRGQIRDVGKPFDAIAKEFCISVWYASKAWIEADRERARKTVQAIYDTARWANTHRAETFQILVRDAHFDADKLKGMVRTTFATSLTPAQVQPVLNMAVEAKIFDRRLDANTLIAKI